MAVKKCYRLLADKSILDNLPRRLSNFLWELDEDFFTKAQWLKRAKEIVSKVNLEAEQEYTVEQLFGECNFEGWCYCTNCEEYFWTDDGHDC